MSKKKLKGRNRNRRKSETSMGHERFEEGGFHPTPVDRMSHRPKKAVKPLEAKNETQGLYISSMVCNPFTFGLGPAGVGKTYVSVRMALEMLNDESSPIEKILITRPAEECEENHGFLPGDLIEKFDPYLMPINDVIEEVMSPGAVTAMTKGGKLIKRPLGFMRGSSLKNTVVILDEAQNTTSKMMKMFLTRIGENSKFIINGDITQCDLDLKPGQKNGLEDAVNRFENTPEFGIIEFTREDQCRHPIITKVIDAYES